VGGGGGGGAAVVFPIVEPLSDLPRGFLVLLQPTRSDLVFKLEAKVPAVIVFISIIC